MHIEWLYHVELYQLYVVCFAILLITVAIGYLRGRFAKDTLKVESLLELIPASLLGLLGLLLGFTFSMAISRFDNRKAVMVREANAIETSWLRAGLLSEHATDAAREALLGYLRHRTDFGLRDQNIKDYDEANQRFQTYIWKVAAAEGQRDRSAVNALFIDSVNGMIDISTERVFASEDHVPEIAYFVIFTLAATCVYTLAYVYGRNRYHVTAPLMLSALLCLLFMLIMDLDRPTRGIIQVNTKMMRDLYENLSQRQER